MSNYSIREESVSGRPIYFVVMKGFWGAGGDRLVASFITREEAEKDRDRREAEIENDPRVQAVRQRQP